MQQTTNFVSLFIVLRVKKSFTFHMNLLDKWNTEYFETQNLFKC